MSAIIWVPEGGARRCPYNYTRQQIPCAHVATLQLTCIPVLRAITVKAISPMLRHRRCLVYLPDSGIYLGLSVTVLVNPEVPAQPIGRFSVFFGKKALLLCSSSFKCGWRRKTRAFLGRLNVWHPSQQPHNVVRIAVTYSCQDTPMHALLLNELVDGVQNKVCGTYVLHTLHGCTLYMGNVCIGCAFEVSTTRIQVSLYFQNFSHNWQQKSVTILNLFDYQCTCT